MYIHAHFFLKEAPQSTSHYKKALAELSKINMRRANKFNLLSVYGALSCMRDITPSKRLGIYLSSEHGPVESLKNVLTQVSQENGVVMPFDFLGINTNASFYVFQALNAQGKHMMLTSHHLSFEKALELAFFDLQTANVEDALIGYVDESLTFIQDYETYTPNEHNTHLDMSLWLYANTTKENAIAHIESCESFETLESLNQAHPNLPRITSLEAILHTHDDALYVAHDEQGKYVAMKITRGM